MMDVVFFRGFVPAFSAHVCIYQCTERRMDERPRALIEGPFDGEASRPACKEHARDSSATCTIDVCCVSRR